MTELQTQQLVNKLQEVTQQRVEDYRGQIDRWNKYQDVLTQIRNKVGQMNGVHLESNVKYNVPIYDQNTEKIIAAMTAIGLVSAGMTMFFTLAYANWIEAVWNGDIYTIHKIEIYNTIALSAFGIFVLTIGYAVQYFARREFKEQLTPYTLVFKVAPKLHINELQHAKTEIKGLPIERSIDIQFVLDPIIKLPPLTMKIPRKWLGQEAVREVMSKMNTIGALPKSDHLGGSY